VSADFWRPVPGWPEYSLSSHGLVRSEERVIRRGDGRLQPVRQRVLRFNEGRVRLSRNGRKYSVNPAQLVDLVFGPLAAS
jgi:hypothetical protein